MAQTIPISLYVTLEMVKVLQCKLLYERDVLMYHPQSDTPLVARTTTLNEELGQVRWCGGDLMGRRGEGGQVVGAVRAVVQQPRSGAPLVARARCAEQDLGPGEGGCGVVEGWCGW